MSHLYIIWLTLVGQTFLVPTMVNRIIICFSVTLRMFSWTLRQRLKDMHTLPLLHWFHASMHFCRQNLYTITPIYQQLSQTQNVYTVCLYQLMLVLYVDCSIYQVCSDVFISVNVSIISRLQYIPGRYCISVNVSIISRLQYIPGM